ncbi:MAG: hypothetical protein GC149_01240 [Gammaproteobacteria bacterium]|nr:hypothetical protein [Gammaproteobacteria bacterium]
MSFNAIIVGMPRSGTSMTAAIFARAGYFIAEDQKGQLRQGDEFNPTGYWEAEPLIHANAEIFQAAGFPYDNTWLYEPITSHSATRINELERSSVHKQFVSDFDQHYPWLWKDPRLCYTLGYWWPLLDRDKTRVLLLKRDPKQIYNSFLRLKWRSMSARDRKDTLQRVKDHMKAAEFAVQKFEIPHIVVNYSDFANNANETAQRINEFFGLNLQSQDLGFDRRANNSNLRGKLSIFLDRIADHMPDKLRKFIKRLIPARLLNLIFPFKTS